MTDEQGRPDAGAQQETPLEREARKNPANYQDPAKPPEGRDVPPTEKVDRGERSTDSPWMGGG